MKFSNQLIGLVDDEQVFHWIAQKFIEQINHGLESVSLYDGSEALDYLQKPESKIPDILFLDLNMPILNGWGFLDEFANLKARLTKKMDIYILSSSVDPEDHKKAKKYPYVKRFLSKPLTKILIEDLLSKA